MPVLRLDVVPRAPPIAYHTTSKVSGIDLRVKSDRVLRFGNFMFVFEAPAGFEYEHVGCRGRNWKSDMKAMLRLPPPVAPHQCEVTVTASLDCITTKCHGRDEILCLFIIVSPWWYKFYPNSPQARLVGSKIYPNRQKEFGSDRTHFSEYKQIPSQWLSVAPNVMCFCDFFLVVLVTSRLSATRLHSGYWLVELDLY